MSFLLIAVGLFLCSVGTGVYAGLRSARALFSSRLWQRIWLASVVVLSAYFFVEIVLRVLLLIPIGGSTSFGLALRLAGMGWLITIPYWLMAAFTFDVVRFVERRRPFLPGVVRAHPARAKRTAWLGAIAAVFVLLLWGYYNHANPVVTPAVVRIDKPAGGLKSLRVAVASDLHMGDLIGRARVAKFVELINSLNADIIVLPGDLVDGLMKPVVEERCGDELRKLRAPLGVYAVLGNHDRDGAVTKYMTDAGITVLWDSAAPIDGGKFYLVGRRDKSERVGGARDGREARKPLAEILREAGVDKAKPVLLLDHQPANTALAEAAAAGADLQISGHTHDGQTWPITWLIRLLYEVPYGIGRKDGMAVLVTSGIGLWGFPARIGSRAEVVDLRVEFAD